MKVFNLTDTPKEYRGRTINPHESVNYEDLTFVPDRDRILEKNKVLAFGSKPSWYETQQSLVAINRAQARAAALKAMEPADSVKTVTTETKSYKRR